MGNKVKKLKSYVAPRIQSVVPKKSKKIKPGLMLSANTKKVLEKRYLKKDTSGKVIETPEKLFRRVAAHIAKAEKKYKSQYSPNEIENKFYDLMTSFKFLPNSPTLMNAGRKLGQLAACFVLPVEDSMKNIFTTLKNAALIHKSGGGTGFSFSRLRPANSRVGTTGGIASGPISFMRVFNTATEQVKQGGTRRGANMAVLRINHPDIMKFIYCKKDSKELNNFNISVAVTDSFMESTADEKKLDLINPANGKKTGELDAAETFRAIVHQAWENGDPGIIFIDRINRDNPTPVIGEIESTNPCGEQPLLPMEACNLGSIDLSKFTVKINDDIKIDFPSLKETIDLAVRFLDNTIDMSKFPLPEITKMVKGNRKIGLGIMGFADLLYQLKVPYNSDKALNIAEKIMQFIQVESKAASKELAKERGAFNNFNISIFKDKHDSVLRNATTTTIAPTGTLSILAGCSSGIEPLFALSFTRNVMDDDELAEVNPHFKRIAKEKGFYSKKLISEVSQKGSIQGMDKIPANIRKIFVTAHDISPEWHIRMQAAFQKYTDNAVSKTVNLPSDATESDVEKVYRLAYKLGCKGVTIYRDGSRDRQVLSISDLKNNDAKFMAVVKARPETLEGFTTKIRTGMGQLYITVTEYDGRPFEVFATIGKSGKSTTAKTEAIGRLISLALRSGVMVENIVEQVKGIGGEHAVFQNGGIVKSIPDAIGHVLEKRYLKNKEGSAKRYPQKNTLKGDTCPDCGETARFEEGCMTCHACGFTKCS